MAYFKDLERLTYMRDELDSALDLTAVGWLEESHPYQRGSVSSEFVARLFELLESVWDPIRFRGKHDCDLCDLCPRELQNEAGQVVDVGATNLFVPKHGDVGLFVAPSLILHYVIDHSYMPPSEFQAALMACPSTNSSSYFRRVGGIIPTTARWRDGLFGFWNSMGAAIANEAGLMSWSSWNFCSDVFDKRRRTFSSKDLAEKAPRWFAERYLEPLASLRERLENQGRTEDARAIQEWMHSVEFLGRQAPVRPPVGLGG